MSIAPTTKRALQGLYVAYGLYLGFVLYNALGVPGWFGGLLAGAALVCHPAAIVSLFFAVTVPIAAEAAFDWGLPRWLEPPSLFGTGLPVLIAASAAYSAWRSRWAWHLWSGPRSAWLVRFLYGAAPYGMALLLLKLAYRDVILWPVVSGLACLIGLRVHAAALLGANRPALRSEAANALLLAGSTLAALIPAEGLARIAYPPVRTSGDVYAPHPEYIFTLAKGAETRFRFPITEEENGEVQWRTSSQGLRDREYGPKRPGETRILLIGDSFTMGHTVEEEETISRLLEERLRERAVFEDATVINGGMSGSGVWQQWGLLTERGLALEPDWVILQVFMPNDIDNALEIVGKRPRAYNTGWHDHLYAMRLRNTPQVRFDAWLRDHCGLYRLASQAMGRTAPIHQVIGGLRLLPPLPDQGPPSEERPAHLEDRLAEWYPELEEGFALMTEYIGRMRALCEERDIRFAAYAFPDASDVFPEVWRNNLAHPQAAGVRYEFRKSLRVMEDHFEREAIPYFSPLRRLAAAGEPDDVFYLIDGHPTPLGNAAAAEAMAAFIVQELRREADRP